MAIPYSMPPIKGTWQYTQERFNEDIQTLKEMLHNEHYDLIIGINRGGCIPAVCLSHALKVPVTMIDYSTRDGANITPTEIVDHFSRVSENYKYVLLVDDLIDSGVAMTHLVKLAQEHFESVHVATLLRNTDVVVGAPQFAATSFSRAEDPRYVDFWWELV